MSQKEAPHFEIEMEVRDYECDLQGIVNNSVYQNYLEHVRHKFLNQAKLDFSKLHDEGIDPVVIKAELEYKFSLRPGDKFIGNVIIRRSGRLRIIFDQEIVRKKDDKLMLKARFTTVLTRNGRPLRADILLDKFNQVGIHAEEI